MTLYDPVVRHEEYRAYYRANVDKVKARNAAYYKADPEKIKARHRRYREKNKDRIKAQQAAFHKANPHRRYEISLKQYYGLAADDYHRMLIEQVGRCAICDNQVMGRGFNVDHCHSTGKVRGLLCSGCNTGLGKLEKAGWREAADRYIARGRGL